MKFHLPKKLLVAILAAMASFPVQAAYYTVDMDEVLNVPAGESITIGSDAQATEHYYAIAKDGEGTAVITGDVVKYKALWVREGELKVGDGTTPTTLTISITAMTRRCMERPCAFPVRMPW